MRYIFLVTLLLLNLLTFSQKAKISLFDKSGLTSAIFSINMGSYRLMTDSGTNYEIGRNEIITVAVENGRILFKKNSRNQGNYKNVFFMQVTETGSMSIKPVFPAFDIHRYQGEFSVSVINEKLQIINIVDLEDYVAGVVESEGGQKANIEYFKTMAVICRTYALGHADRHASEGFQLCDGVHCQVYLGMCIIRPEIIAGVKATEKMVIVDSENNLITAAFHSNCGGTTVNSENVWTNPKSYLVSVHDTFCAGSAHANWEQIISQEKWRQYLKITGFQCVESMTAEQLSFSQPVRKIYYTIGKDSIPLKKLRNDWDLKSTWFSITPRDSVIILKGRGFGHGIGLCQEGAMEMADKGFKYQDIIRHYYFNIKIIKR